MESERSGIESEIDDAKLSAGFLGSLSSLALSGAPANERLDEPDVDTVESEEDEGWDGCPSLAWVTLGKSVFGAETDLFSCRSWGVLLKAYGAIGAEVPL